MHGVWKFQAETERAGRRGASRSDEFSWADGSFVGAVSHGEDGVCV